jgi:predicted nucleotidyltransferase
MGTLHERYESILERLVDELRAAYGSRLVTCAVYGSVGRGTMREDSDIDFLIVARDLPDGRWARVREFDPIEARLAPMLRPRLAGAAPIELSPVFKTPDEVEARSPLFLDMVEDARLLHDRDGFFAGFLDRMRERMRRLGSRRVWRGNAWYWDVKPDYKPGEVFEWP